VGADDNDGNRRRVDGALDLHAPLVAALDVAAIEPNREARRAEIDLKPVGEVAVTTLGAPTGTRGELRIPRRSCQLLVDQR
jgi:hypothetical protein